MVGSRTRSSTRNAGGRGTLSSGGMDIMIWGSVSVDGRGGVSGGDLPVDLHRSGRR